MTETIVRVRTLVAAFDFVVVDGSREVGTRNAPPRQQQRFLLRRQLNARTPVCPSSEALLPMFALVAMARLLLPWGELIIGVIADTAVLVGVRLAFVTVPSRTS